MCVCGTLLIEQRKMKRLLNEKCRDLGKSCRCFHLISMILLFAYVKAMFYEVNNISGTKRACNTGIQGNDAATGIDEPPQKKLKIGKHVY